MTIRLPLLKILLVTEIVTKKLRQHFAGSFQTSCTNKANGFMERKDEYRVWNKNFMGFAKTNGKSIDFHANYPTSRLRITS